MGLTYGGAGVDVKGIKKSQNRIGRIMARTHGAGTEHGFGHYAGMVDGGGGMLIATHTDGVGTKVMIAGRMKKYDTVGIDCIAMNVNDVVCVGARPVSFVDYIAASKNDGDILSDIARGLARGAVKASVPIVGGETAIMPGLFSGRGFAFDLAGTVVGLVPRKKMILGSSIKQGDAIIGAHSTGLHSNGYSLARKALGRLPLNTKMNRGTLGDALLAPTEIYSAPVLEAASKCKVHGLAHITGGSFTKLPRLKDAGFEIDALPEPPEVMRLIKDRGVSEKEMYRTFNMGVGFCVVAPESEQGRIISIFKRHRIRSGRIGRIIRDKGVFVNSKRIA
ncbi:phosphoribosylaminoimidazole (AIR) synthetase [Cenarchaeum symbiosum A]|uniref:Phosphoribosylformylglycinamidine cyclo-ligase n=1 Tax=Cenarchaeum symbiosum (strain A) TaxID=414004 RepID=A0RWR1_CENSY|nr:phosphoribosylaminoimidazole (AIR) synthetase [Cenarchaeum symbiosum A]